MCLKYILILALYYVAVRTCSSTPQVDKVIILPPYAVRPVEHDFSVLCNVSYAIETCHMNIGSKSYILKPDDQNSSVIYSGKGLDAGECGAYIKSVTKEMHGQISCHVPSRKGNTEIQSSMTLVIATAPGEPTLVSPNKPTFNEDELFMAMCVAPGGRPAAKITWFLDEEKIQGVDPPIVTADPDSDTHTIRQNFSRTLRADDNNKILTCKVEHEALDEPKEKKLKLIVCCLELGAGSIIGIVVAVLILLIAVSLGVFAFVTGRWCFAGRARDNTNKLDETSETESVTGTRFNSGHPCGKNKLQAQMRAPVETERVDDKVIYAELSLVDHTREVRPPPPPSEYAEITCTTKNRFK